MEQMEQMHEEFILQQREADDWDFICSLILAHAAPTIAGLKPATLMAFSDTGKPLGQLWETHRERFLRDVAPRVRLSYFRMKSVGSSELGLFYREDLLRQVLSLRRHILFLERQGIDCSDPWNCLRSIQTQFVRRFPHEIGILLGYPLDDVLGFMKHRGKNAYFDGYWKVYSHPRAAAALFRCFERSKSIVYEYFLRKWEGERMGKTDGP